MTDDTRLGRRASDPTTVDFERLAKDFGRLSRALNKLSRDFAAHVRAYEQHVQVDRERNGRIQKAEAAIASLQDVTNARLTGIEHGGDARAQRLEQIGDLIVRIEAYQRGRAEVWASIGQTCVKALPGTLRWLAGGAGFGAFGFVAAWALGLLGHGGS